VLDGSESIERYERLDDGSKPNYAEVRKSVNVKVSAGKIDLVLPYAIHAEESGDERTVAIIVRAEKAGGFLQGRYDPRPTNIGRVMGPSSCRLNSNKIRRLSSI